MLLARRRRDRRRPALGPRRRAVRRDEPRRVRAARRADLAVGALVGRARAELRRGGPHALLPRRVRGRDRRRAARAARRARAWSAASCSGRCCRSRTRWRRASGRARSPRTSSPTASARPSSTGTRSAPSRRSRSRSRSGSARGGPAACGCARSPTRPSACACSPSCSRSRAARWPPRSVAAMLWLAIVPLRLRSLPVMIVARARRGRRRRLGALEGPVLEEPPAARGEGGRGGRVRAARGADDAAAVRRRPRGRTWACERGLVSMRTRRRAGVVAVAVACLVPLVAFTSVALSGNDRRPRQPSSRARPRSRPTRAATGSSPPRRRAASTGARPAGCSRTARRWASAPAPSPWRGCATGPTPPSRAHAHGFVPQTLADLGIVGRGADHAAAARLARRGAAHDRAAAAAAAVRASQRHEPRPRRDWDSDRIALVALSLAAVAFGLQSIIDWTWFIPGPAVLALVAAGYVAGRGPAAALPERRARRARGRPTGRIAQRSAWCSPRLVLAWAVWQPEASDRATGEALELADEGRFAEAIAKTRGRRRTLNPLSPEPLLVRASIQTAGGRRGRARETPSSRPCSASPATRRPGTGWPPSSSARSNRPDAGARDAARRALPRSRSGTRRGRSSSRRARASASSRRCRRSASSSRAALAGREREQRPASAAAATRSRSRARPAAAAASAA